MGSYFSTEVALRKIRSNPLQNTKPPSGEPKEGFYNFIEGYESRLHHAAHATAHAAAHWWHSWFVFFFFNQHTFGGEEHAGN